MKTTAKSMTAAAYRAKFASKAKKRRTSAPSRFIAPAEPRVVAPLAVEIELAIAVRSERNLRGHDVARWKRGKVQAEAVWFALMARTDVRDEIAMIAKSPAVLVTMTRIGPKKLDGHDNLREAFKAVADAVSRMLGIDDGDEERIDFAYAWEKNPAHGARVRIESA